MPADFGWIWPTPDDSGWLQLRVTPAPGGASDSDFTTFGIRLTLADVESVLWVRSKELNNSCDVRSTEPISAWSG